MVRVIIADDEEFERTYLSRFIEEHYCNVMTIVYAARDGAELVEKAAELKPDLIMMDIRMPRMDGLEAAAQLRRQLPKTEIVILSAYGEFSYAKRALQLGVKDFLVKPYLNEELSATLDKLLVGLAAVSSDSLQPDLNELMNNRPVDIVWDMAFDRRKETSVRRELFSCGVDGETFKCLAFYHNGVLKLGGMGREIIRHHFEKPTVAVVGNDLLSVFVLYLFSNEEVTYSDLNTGIRKTREYLLELDDSQVLCGVSGVYSSLKDTGNAFREASAFIEDYDKQYRRVEQDVRNLCEMEQRLSFFILNRNYRQSYTYANEQSALLQKYYGEETKEMYAAIERMLFAVLRQLLTQLDFIEGDAAVRQLYGIFTADNKNVNQMLNNGIEFFEELVEQKPFISGNVQIVRKTKAYLEEHYNEDLNLQLLADVLGVSAGYLSKSFKAQTGSSFTEYLTDVRIDAAKQMIRETEQSISDISYAVGFSDPGYFSKCFRKRENLSPSEFAAMQKMHLLNE